MTKSADESTRKEVSSFFKSLQAQKASSSSALQASQQSQKLSSLFVNSPQSKSTISNSNHSSSFQCIFALFHSYFPEKQEGVQKDQPSSAEQEHLRKANVENDLLGIVQNMKLHASSWGNQLKEDNKVVKTKGNSQSESNISTE